MKRWLSRIAALVALLLLALIGAVVWTAQRTEHPVGFDVGRATNSLGRPFAIAIWYPTNATPWPTTPLGVTLMSVARGGPVQGQRLPLVIVSHETHRIEQDRAPRRRHATARRLRRWRDGRDAAAC